MTTNATHQLDEIGSVRLPDAVRREIEHRAQAAYPHEACGVLVGELLPGSTHIERAVPARNANRERPRDRYELDPGDYVAADRLARAAGLDIVGFWHSHPDHPARPSRTDLEAAWPGYTYLIVTTTASGADGLRTWRLGKSGFYEQAIQEEDPS